MSPEMLEGLQYDQSTDVFSYGVLLWELFAEARPDLLAQEAVTQGPMMSRLLQLLCAGKRLTADAAWPQRWQVVMVQCWQTVPAHRPSFATILAMFDV